MVITPAYREQGTELTEKLGCKEWWNRACTSIIQIQPCKLTCILFLQDPLLILRYGPNGWLAYWRVCYYTDVSPFFVIRNCEDKDGKEGFRMQILT